MYDAVAGWAGWLLAAPGPAQLETRLLQGAWLYLAVVGLPGLLTGRPAPYGKFALGAGDGLLGWVCSAGLPAPLAWALQELPSLLIPLLAVVRLGPGPGAWLLLPFIAHYANRSLVYPLRLVGARPVPLLTASSAFFFTAYNGLMQSQAVMNLAAPPPLAAQAVGLALFLAGLAVNLHSDSVLRGLRAGGGTGYHIPHGGLFALLSAPHYTGECIEWIGFALFTQSPAALWFAVWNLVFLGSRALQTHAWYKEKFGGDYPPGRRAFIPFVF